MPSLHQEFSDSDSDDGFNEDMEALRRACQLTGKSPTDHQLQPSSAAAAAANGGASSEVESDGEGEDELQLVRCIQKRFAVQTDEEEGPLKMKPLCTLPPEWSDSDDCEDDYETLRAIQRRFNAYIDDGLKDKVEGSLRRPLQVGATIIDSEKETSNSFVERTNDREGFLNCVDTSEPAGKKSEPCDDAGRPQPSELVEWDGPVADDVAGLSLNTSHFPKSALSFVDAIKKNRSNQKLLRSKMMQMEARIEELNKLIERVKILKDFQVACKKRTGRALSQKKDPRVQLISVPKLRTNTKSNEKKIPALSKGPPENLHVANYKEALATFAAPVSRENWSKEERENLVKGVKQQFQGMLLQRSVDLLSEADGSYGSSNVDSIIESIKDIDITPEKLRSFLPKVNWEQLAAMYVPGRSGAECQARFLNSEDPLINSNPWTTMEDKNLLHIVQQKGLSDWIDIAASLGTNRTPFQCLARYQRSLNASMLKREWTKEEDNQLRAAVETYGESNWQVVASVMEGRTGTQCSNRWLKTLHPTRKRVGKWTAEEDKRLKVAVTLFGPKTWKKVARCVPGRTQVQCRERWVNCLDPSLNMAEWTEEEDLKLEEAIAEHGYCWSKVAACIPHRTDNQCWRRWKVLFPNEVPLLQAARKVQKTALISNFVDRESERPALGPKDFRVPETYLIAGSENVDLSRRKKTRSRLRKAHKNREEDVCSGEISAEEVLRSKNGGKLENLQGKSRHGKARGKSSRSAKSNAGSHLSGCPDTVLSDMSNGKEIRESRVNDGNRKKKARSRKKKAGVKSEYAEAASSSGAIIPIEPRSKEYEHSEPTGECLPTIAYPDLQEVLSDDAQKSKAPKVYRRRKNCKTLKEVPETLSEVDRQAASKRNMKKEKKKLSNATNSHISSFPDSMSLMDIKEATEAARGIKARKTKRKTQETCSSTDCMSLAVVDQRVNSTLANTQNKTSLHSSRSMKLLRDKSSSCQVGVAPNQHFKGNADDGVSENLEDSTLSDCNGDLQHKDNAISLSETDEDSITLASFLQQSGADGTRLSSAKFGNSPRKRKISSLADIDSITADVSVTNRPKRQKTRDVTRLSRMVEAEAGSRKDDEGRWNQALQVEAGDDTTLAHFYNKLKNRRTGAP